MKAQHKWKFLELSSLNLIGILTLALFCPIQNNVQAESPDLSPFSAEVATKTSVKAYATISVALDSAVNIDLTPRSGGSFNASSARLQVGTNNTTGYAIFLQTIDNSQNLNAVDSQNTSKITAINGTMTANNYTNNLNTWGYALTPEQAANADTPYRAIPQAGDSAIQTIDTTSGSDIYYLNIGAAIDTSLPAGEYRNSVIVSVVANPITITGFQKIYYMQEMTPEICASATLHEAGQLVDRRDNQIYTVAKLTDHTCWMTKNLALKLSTATTLTPDDSNVSQNWTPQFSTSLNEMETEPTDVGKSWLDTSLSESGYYQFSAATAGSSIPLSQDHTLAPDSICPKGWKLPSASHDAPNVIGSYAELFATYHISTPSASGAELLLPPLSFTYSGAVSNLGGINSVGLTGHYWTSEILDETHAWRLIFSSSEVDTGGIFRYRGNTIRCVATAE